MDESVTVEANRLIVGRAIARTESQYCELPIDDARLMEYVGDDEVSFSAFEWYLRSYVACASYYVSLLQYRNTKSGGKSPRRR